jgi:hypothetical protein
MTPVQQCYLPFFCNSWRPNLQLLGRPVPTYLFLVAPEELISQQLGRLFPTYRLSVASEEIPDIITNISGHFTVISRFSTVPDELY